MEIDPLAAPLAATFRDAMLRAIVRSLDQSDLVAAETDRRGDAFASTVFDLAFFVLLQLEEARGFEAEASRFHAHLVFTPLGEHPGETSRLVTQPTRAAFHGELTEDEVHAAIESQLIAE